MAFVRSIRRIRRWAGCRSTSERASAGWWISMENFFDRVNHDVLMSRVARVVSDVRVLKLIRRFLEAGMMREGLVQARKEGTPQGGPLSPLLSNILLRTWTGSWKGASSRFAASRMTATSTCAVAWLANG